MNLYVISDTHFYHKNIIEFTGRPTDFSERLWKGFDTLEDEDVLIHCGDITMGMDAMVHEKLKTYKFKKWLIRGNHDKHSIAWYTKNGWDSVFDEALISMFGERILFTHAPYPKRQDVSKNIHGHLHGGKSRGRPDFYDESYHIEVTPEVIGYVPARVGNQII